MRRSALSALFVLGTILAGCATYWTKPGFNPADWNRDRYECERDMRQSGYYGSGLFGAINAQNFFEECLVARGYYKTRRPDVAQAQERAVPDAPTLSSNDARSIARADLLWKQHLLKVGAMSEAEYAEGRAKLLQEFPDLEQ
jgi:hypothetical protein